MLIGINLKVNKFVFNYSKLIEKVENFQSKIDSNQEKTNGIYII